MQKTSTSIHQLFLNAAHKIHTPNKAFLWYKHQNKYVSVSYGQAEEKINQIAAFLLSKGLQKGDKVALIQDNAPEYLYFDQALMKLGLVNVSIYPTLTAEETAYILNDSESKGILIGSHFLLKKFEKVANHCPQVGFVICNFQGKHPEYPDLSHVYEEGAKLLHDLMPKIEARFQEVKPNDLATLIYTSGTTGSSKGAMLTHHNFISNCEDAMQLCPAINEHDKFLSFLPLSHVYERMVSYILVLYIGAEIAYAESLEKIAQNFGEAQPTIAACVPRVLEKVEYKIKKNALGAGGFKAAIFNWALSLGEKKRLAYENNKKPNLFTQIFLPIADKLVYSKIKQRLGGKVKLIVSGGGALPVHVGEFFGNIGIKVQEGYGLTETSPFISVNEFHRQVLGTVGRVAPSQKVAIQNIETLELITIQTYDSFQPHFESEEGEILVKGPNVMQGYWNKKEETKAVFDSEGWFHTGDIGKFEKGYLKITDRLKNMLKTSLGKNIYPTPIENNYLKSNKIEQMFIIGDKREYVTAIIVPDKDELMTAFGFKEDFFLQPEPMIEDKAVKEWLIQDIKTLSLNLAKYERIKDFVIKKNPFSLEENELTVTQKQKRKVIEAKYAYYIEGMYASEESDLLNN